MARPKGLMLRRDQTGIGLEDGGLVGGICRLFSSMCSSPRLGSVGAQLYSLNRDLARSSTMVRVATPHRPLVIASPLRPALVISPACPLKASLDGLEQPEAHRAELAISATRRQWPTSWGSQASSRTPSPDPARFSAVM